MTYHDDLNIDQKELAEIQTLMTQLNFTPDQRMQIREFIMKPDENLEDILCGMEKNVPSGSNDALHISLIKDLIRVYRATNKDKIANECTFIMDLAEKYSISKEQVDVIEQACINDEKILEGEVDDKQIIKNSKELASKAAAVGVPIAAIYLSGSVIGLSATGITSGLAALGLGGVLGLSSMVTGIGMAVLLGVGAYKGVKWITNDNKRKKIEKREFMIQEIIKINQKTINNLAEDVNYFAIRIVDLTKEVEIDKLTISKLAEKIDLFTRALSTLKNKGDNLEGVIYAEKK